jgi:hypothetical protein
MIISASYKTDIPAFYGEWFLRRLRAGYCRMVNPYNRRSVQISLRCEDVDGFVFWTKNLGPFLEVLEEVRELGYPFYIQYSINSYPRDLEVSVTHPERSIEHMHRVRERFGEWAGVWRYDPVLFTSLTPLDHHRQSFRELASRLEGATDEVVISFAQIYRKTQRNLEAAARHNGFQWEDPEDEVKLRLGEEMAAVAAEHGMRLTVCSQSRYVPRGGSEARCIDGLRLSRIAGHLVAAPEKGNRPDCRCARSRDIGEYDTCPHGCVYCYAVQHRALARRRYRQHDPEGEYLFAPQTAVPEGSVEAGFPLPLWER